MKNCSHGLLLRLLLGAALAAAAAASVMVLDSRGNVEMVDSEYDARYDSLRANALSVRGVWAVVTQVRRGLRPPPQHPTGREKWTRTQSPIRDSGELMPAGTWPTPPESVGVEGRDSERSWERSWERVRAHGPGLRVRDYSVRLQIELVT